MSEQATADPAAPFVGFTAAKRRKAIAVLRDRALARRGHERATAERYPEHAAAAKRDADAYEAAIVALEAVPALVQAYRAAKRGRGA